MKNMKSISDKDMIYHKPLLDTKNISFDQNKKPKKQPKNRQAIKDVELVRRSTLSIRLALKDFCVQFLENCYNPLMRAVKVRKGPSLSCLLLQLRKCKCVQHINTYF